ncbi:hypothetical protein [Allobaculum sp. JKK-2023]|uniref:hypothetical protein n=1 Tax=Allobaculum sp. JKK-2023 TaxID=3108943 RepID=UPI002B059AB9|nr:hypothetical protein [Allobaculum sp. JKK-2023]
MHEPQSTIVLENIKEFISELSDFHHDLSNEWICFSSNSINFKHNLRKLYTDSNFLLYLKDYQKFVRRYLLVKRPKEPLKECDSFAVQRRVKEWDSLRDKIDRYLKRPEKGEVPLKKCLNDIVGFRLNLKCSLDKDDLLQHLKSTFDNPKKFSCIDATKNGYTAIHVYIRESNLSPSWEIQIWNQKDINSNLQSHEAYKQDYTKYSERK